MLGINQAGPRGQGHGDRFKVFKAVCADRKLTVKIQSAPGIGIVGIEVVWTWEGMEY